MDIPLIPYFQYANLNNRYVRVSKPCKIEM